MNKAHSRHKLEIVRRNPFKTNYLWCEKIWDEDINQFRHHVLLQLKKGRLNCWEAGVPPTDFSPGESRNLIVWSGYTIPRLVDAHVHLSLPCKESQFLNRRLLDWFQNGVTVIRDPGDKQCHGLRQMRNQRLKKRLPVHPYVISAGEALRQGGYGGFLGQSRTTRQALAERIDQLADRGVRWAKVIVTGIIDFAYPSRVGETPWHPDDLFWLADYCRQRQLKVMAHANGPGGISLALAAGVDSIEHGYFIAEEQLEHMARAKTAWVPTALAVHIHTLEPQLRRLRSAQERQAIQKIMFDHGQALKKAFEFGVPVMAGTDSGAPGVTHGSALWSELALWLRYGISIENALKAATSTPCHQLGLKAQGLITRHRLILYNYSIDLGSPLQINPLFPPRPARVTFCG